VAGIKVSEEHVDEDRRECRHKGQHHRETSRGDRGSQRDVGEDRGDCDAGRRIGEPERFECAGVRRTDVGVRQRRQRFPENGRVSDAAKGQNGGREGEKELRCTRDHLQAM